MQQMNMSVEAVRDQALDWFVRLQNEPVPEAERADWRRWLAADPAHAAAFQEVEALWQAPALATALTREPERRRPRLFARSAITALAACLLLAIAGVWALDLPLRLQADYRTAVGAALSTTLADGSTLRLDTDSAVAVDVTGRTVTLLRGQAFFQVRPDPARPFTVSTSFGAVQVTGTAFAVALAPKEMQVTVREGSVRVTSAGTAAVHLMPGQQLRSTAVGAGTPEAADMSTALSWLGGRLVFQDRPLADVIAALDRYHPGVILLPNAALGERRISGNYGLEDPARVAAALASITGAELTKLSDFVLILR